MEKLINLYRQWRGESPVHIEKLQMAGSNREYYRMADADGATVIGVIGTSRDENHAFIYLSGHFTRRRLPVPQILAASEDELCYLQTDLGTVSLFDALSGGRQAGGRYNQREKALLTETIRSCQTFRYAARVVWSGRIVTRSLSLMRQVCCSISIISNIVFSNLRSSISMS